MSPYRMNAREMVRRLSSRMAASDVIFLLLALAIFAAMVVTGFPMPYAWATLPR